MIFKTDGIVLRTIKYGETSIVTTVFTEVFGVQAYLINGVRTQKKSGKAHYYQPGSLLEMQVYHNPLKNLQRIKEARWKIVYTHLFSDVIKHTVALYMVELLFKCLKQPEANPELFTFCEDSFIEADKATGTVMANFPLYFALHLPYFFGFRLHNNYSQANPVFDIREGRFTTQEQAEGDVVDPVFSFYLSELSRTLHPHDLEEIKMKGNMRLSLLKEIERFYAWNIPDFGPMKTLDVLAAILQ